MASRLGKSQPLHQEPDQPRFYICEYQRNTQHPHGRRVFPGHLRSESTGSMCRGCGPASLPRVGFTAGSLRAYSVCFAFCFSLPSFTVGFWIPSLGLNNSRHHIATMSYTREAHLFDGFPSGANMLLSQNTPANVSSHLLQGFWTTPYSTGPGPHSPRSLGWKWLP